VSLPLILYLRGWCYKEGNIQYDHNQHSISTYLFYIYFYRYNYLCIGEQGMILCILLDGGPSGSGPLLRPFESMRVVPWVPIIVTTFVWRPAQKFGTKKGWYPGWEETSPGPLILTIKVTYIILKNKPWKNWPHKSGILTICIGFYCDIEQTSKTVVPCLVRTTLSMMLYEIDVCMKLFNMASYKFGERDETNRVARLPFT
jgi:hypothetical protein